MLPRRYYDCSQECSRAMQRFEERTRAELLAEAQRPAYVRYLNAHPEIVASLIHRAELNRYALEEVV